MAGKKENFLDYTPAISPRNGWDVKGNGLVTIHMEHRGFFPWIAQTFFGRPRVSHIDLDRVGSFIFQRIDGVKTVHELAQLVSEEFGEEAEPLYSRLVEYLQILRNNRFIYYAGRDKNPK